MSMIERETLLQLAEFQSTADSAISFYFQPPAPQDRSHRDETILIKDLVREAERRARSEHRRPATADLERILGLAPQLAGNHSRAKAVFADHSQGVWHEFDIPAQLGRSELIINRRFHLKPLVNVLSAVERCGILLIDRKRARIFELADDQIREVEDIRDDLPRAGRSDGFAGYDAGHKERHVENEALRHFKYVLERTLERRQAGAWQHFVLGCRDEIRAEVEPQLHPYLRESLAGRFSRDVATATPEQVRADAEGLLGEYRENRRQGLIRESLGEAQRNGRGAVGLRHVLQALEMREVQALLIGQDFTAIAVECPNCGHVDSRNVPACAVCGHTTRSVDDVADALVWLAMRNQAELVEVTADAEFERAGNVAALLRFRADRKTPASVAS
jgi:peptide subunit release factor 1 (eRF1)